MSAAVEQLELGPMANFIYLVGDPIARECAVVDPAWDVPAIRRSLEEGGWTPTAVLVSHNHRDHTNGIQELLGLYDLPVFVHADDAGALKGLGKNVRPCRGGEMVRVGGLEVELLHTPGHTAGSQCFRFQDRLATGDTLFIGGCGRVDLPTSDPEQMYTSLRRIASLPGGTFILPGHDYGPTRSAALAAELKSNPYLRLCAAQDEDEFLSSVRA